MLKKKKGRKGNKWSVPRGLPGPSPSSGTGKALATLFSSRPPCPWVVERGAPELWPHDRRGLSGIPWWRNSRAMLCHPTLAWDSRLDGVHWPSAQPPCSPPKFPSVYLWLFLLLRTLQWGNLPLLDFLLLSLLLLQVEIREQAKRGGKRGKRWIGRKLSL